MNFQYIIFSECLFHSSMSIFITKMLLLVLTDLKITILTNQSFIYPLNYLYFISTSTMQLVTVLFLTINIAPMFSTLTMIGSLTENFMLHSNWTTNITFYRASKSASHLASELNKVMLLYAIDIEYTGPPRRYSTKPLFHIFVTGSQAQSLLLKHPMPYDFFLPHSAPMSILDF